MDSKAEQKGLCSTFSIRFMAEWIENCQESARQVKMPHFSAFPKELVVRSGILVKSYMFAAQNLEQD